MCNNYASKRQQPIGEKEAAEADNAAGAVSLFAFCVVGTCRCCCCCWSFHGVCIFWLDKVQKLDVHIKDCCDHDPVFILHQPTYLPSRVAPRLLLMYAAVLPSETAATTSTSSTFTRVPTGHAFYDFISWYDNWL